MLFVFKQWSLSQASGVLVYRDKCQQRVTVFGYYLPNQTKNLGEKIDMIISYPENSQSHGIETWYWCYVE